MASCKPPLAGLEEHNHMASEPSFREQEGFLDHAAIVTGAGSGMGRATALALARRALAVAVMDRDGASAEATVAAIRAQGGRAEAFVVDVARAARVDAAVARIARRLGAVGYLVNIAGVDWPARLETIGDADWARMFAVAVDGTFHLCRAALPTMMERRFGRIVNMSSLHAIRGQAERAHYAASKGAIIAFTKSLAREKAASNIRVNAVAPGPIDTPLWRAGRAGRGLARQMKERAAVIPLGRLGRPEEIAEAIVFLLSERSSYITGHVLTADGGEIMG
jgi:NAD(P)-dependent dehydrogenase (short-subunit alcohol dehydrogenase family)